MTNPVVIDGARLLSWARRTAQKLEMHREEINSLNVFPVPDSDTGSNMAHTMSAAVAQAESLEPGATCADIASALAIGSVKGARGNSGVVLSQVLRGVAQAATEGDLDGANVAEALSNAVVYVDRAINEPVEGTIVTVLREAAQAAKGALAVDKGLVGVTAAAVAAAEAALEKTPSQLAELRDAGVVDAGGRGLVLILAALRDEVSGNSDDSQVQGSTATDSFTFVSEEDSHGHTGWLEIMFMFSGPVDELESAIAPLGTSLVTARVSDTEAKIHIHSLQAGTVIEQAYGLGAVTDLRLEILPDANEEVAGITADRLIIALAPEGAVAGLYRQAGATVYSPGAELASEVAQCVTANGTEDVIVLPNGQTDCVQLSHVEQAAVAVGAHIAVLHTTRLVGGIAALAVHDPRLPLDAAVAHMDEAAADMRAADIVRSETGRLTATTPDGVLAEGESVQEVVDKACAKLLADGGELITLLLATEAASAVDVAELEASLDAEILIYPADGMGMLGQIGVE